MPNSVLPSQSEPLSTRLKSLIAEIERSAKMAHLVSRNADGIASENKSSTRNAFAFETVASQMKTISEDALSRISVLREILSEMDSLTSTINLAGRQRMLSQRMMKLVLTQRFEEIDSPDLDEEIRETKLLFDKSMEELINNPLNTPSIKNKLLLTQGVWQCFLGSLNRKDYKSAAEENESVLKEMNEAVQLYKSLVHP
ncbi:type IV pili methyl-accepting chemotaxis transducer N-terminal domain-containing protein [Pelagicoccus albus]|uniref:Type IV pili methyl-accepting chemotaxis transducer N-terminal domain-containing protein n=1 Tax=Pelagicoccus albus TaxID=415222 RepID=A0A7X1B7T8_9BACT|nr:type IV pili methyl-accepting chemotaxis transducer N-terminal domain-containing protein [Pelagicoccus albus]MBC2607268.1 type IV pili methyl-accepting chemotaxis transducer N-terminal domain-containing protein [Pelagicoccus albus]